MIELSVRTTNPDGWLHESHSRSPFSRYDGFIPAGFEPTVAFVNDPSTSEWVPLHEGEAAGLADRWISPGF